MRRESRFLSRWRQQKKKKCRYGVNEVETQVKREATVNAGVDSAYRCMRTHTCTHTNTPSNGETEGIYFAIFL